MKFAFIIQGNFNSQTDRAVIDNGTAQIIGVANVEEGCAIAKELYENGVDCIELCGAFGKEGAKRIIAATENQIPVGFVTHLPSQDKIYKRFFPDNHKD